MINRKTNKMSDALRKPASRKVWNMKIQENTTENLIESLARLRDGYARLAENALLPSVKEEAKERLRQIDAMMDPTLVIDPEAGTAELKTTKDEV